MCSADITQQYQYWEVTINDCDTDFAIFISQSNQIFSDFTSANLALPNFPPGSTVVTKQFVCLSDSTKKYDYYQINTNYTVACNLLLDTYIIPPVEYSSGNYSSYGTQRTKEETLALVLSINWTASIPILSFYGYIVEKFDCSYDPSIKLEFYRVGVLGNPLVQHF
jgi:hypothetical protein